MNIYWCGGEDLDFLNNVWASATAGYRDTSFSRCALTASANNTVSRSVVFAGSPLFSGWVHKIFYLYDGGVYAPTSNLLTFGAVEHATMRGVWIGPKLGDLSALQIMKVATDGSATVLATSAAGTITVGSLFAIDIQFTDLGSNPGTVKVFVDQNEVMSYTGDLTIADFAGVDQLALQAHNWGINRRYYGAFSQLIVADSDTRTLKLATLAPSAAGDTNDWTGEYTAIDEVAIDDSDVVYSDTADDDFQCGLTNSPAGSYAVDAIRIAVRACKTGDSAVGSLKLGVKSDGNVDVDAGQALGLGWATHERITHTIHSTQITTTILDAMQKNLRASA